MLISISNTLLFLTVFMEQMFYMLFMEIHRLFLHLDLAFLSFPHRKWTQTWNTHSREAIHSLLVEETLRSVLLET